MHYLLSSLHLPLVGRLAVQAVIALTLLAPAIPVQARLILYQSCEYVANATSPCKQLYGSVAELERYVSNQVWNDASLPCRNMARQTPAKVWEQALELVGSGAKDGVVLTCIDPESGRRFRSVVVREPTRRADTEAYNRQQALRLADEMGKRPTPQMLADPGQACVPITLFSMLHAGKPGPAAQDFRRFISELAAGSPVGTLTDVRKYFDTAGGVKAVDVKDLFADQGLPLQGLSGTAADVFDAIGDALDQGRLVAVRVDGIALLRAGQQYDKTRRKVLSSFGIDLDSSGPSEHMARVVAVRRTAAGTVRELAVYDPSLFLLGNEPYWVEPRALHLALFNRLLPRIEVPTAPGRLLGYESDRVFVTQRAVLPALTLR